ncbi:hypothetical protein Droror1_Dr00020398 [Drosera rotundifolia]
MASSSPTKHWYSVWALPPSSTNTRVKTLMTRLRSEFGGPEFEPHVTVVGAVEMTEEDAINRFEAACEGVREYVGEVDGVEIGTFFYQCVFMLLKKSREVLENSANCCSHFGYKNSSLYMPHMSLIYGDLTDEEKKKKKKAQEKAIMIDESISSLRFPITRFGLYETDVGDKTTKSWKKVAECDLISG